MLTLCTKQHLLFLTPHSITKKFPFWNKNVVAQYKQIISGSYTWPVGIEISCAGLWKLGFSVTNFIPAKEFVRLLLEPDPVLRITAAQALEHPWITSALPQQHPSPRSTTLTDTTSSLKSVIKKGLATIVEVS